MTPRFLFLVFVLVTSWSSLACTEGGDTNGEQKRYKEWLGSLVRWSASEESCLLNRVRADRQREADEYCNQYGTLDSKGYPDSKAGIAAMTKQCESLKLRDWACAKEVQQMSDYTSTRILCRVHEGEDKASGTFKNWKDCVHQVLKNDNPFRDIAWPD